MITKSNDSIKIYTRILAIVMIKKFSKLSLSKTKYSATIHTKMDSDDSIPSNQEALTKITDLDLSIKLPESNHCFDETAASGISDIVKIMKERQLLSKKRESLVYGQKTGIYPVWFSVKPKCHMNLESEEDDDKFKSAWACIAKGVSRDAAQKVVDYLNTEIKGKESEINQVRASTIRKIGFSTENSALARKNLDKEIIKLNEENTTELNNFRIQLSSTQCLPATISKAPKEYTRPRTWNHPQQKRENRGYRGFRRNQYKPY